MCFFLFGFHVHEKAILMAAVPLSLVAFSDPLLARPAFFINTVGSYSLFPLLFQPAEVPLKLLVFVAHTLVAYAAYGQAVTGLFERLYLCGLGGVFAFAEVIHPIWISPRLVFSPLLLTSVYCSLGIVYAWLLLYYACLYSPKMKTS